MNKMTKIIIFLFPLMLLISCGPSEEDIREQVRLEYEQLKIEQQKEEEKNKLELEKQNKEKKEEIVSGWWDSYSLLDGLKYLQETAYLFKFTSINISEDRKALSYNERQYDQIGLKGIERLAPKMGIPDSILYSILSTRPGDGNRKDTYENVEITWSVSTRGSPPDRFIYLRVNLSLIE